MKKCLIESNEEIGSKNGNRIFANNSNSKALMCLNLAHGSLIVNSDPRCTHVHAIRLLIEDAIESLQRYD
jgi:hypothetical protein